MIKEIDYDWDDEHHTPKIIDSINKLLNQKKFKKLNHLDVGCGNGALTIKFKKFFKTTLGIDLSKKGIFFAKKYENKNLKFKYIGLNQLIKKKKKFKFVTSIEVIEHQYDPLKFLKELNSITSKNGYILISTPFHGYIKNLIISLLNLNDRHYTALWKHGHIKFFSIKTFKQLIKISKLKLKIENIQFSGRFYPFSHSMLFLLKKEK